MRYTLPRLFKHRAILIVDVFSATYDAQGVAHRTRSNLNEMRLQMTKEGWITRKANAAAKRARSRAVAQEALANTQRRIAGTAVKESVSSPAVAATEPVKSAPMPAPRPSSASPELIRASEVADYRRAVFGSAIAEESHAAPFEPVFAPPAPPPVRKQVFEFEGRFYEDRGLKRETQDVESYICSRGRCHRTKLHRIEVELVLVPSYPRQFLGIEFEVGEPKDGIAMWVPKAGQSIPRYGGGGGRR